MKTRLSESNSIFGQGIILAFFVPFNIFLWKIVLSANFSSSTLLFAICITLLSLLIGLLAFKTADVSIDNGAILVRRLFGTKRIPAQQYRAIGAFLPLGYYLEFKDGMRVYVLFGLDEIGRQFTTSKPNEIIEEIRSHINRELGI